MTSGEVDYIRDVVPIITPQNAAEFARRSHEPNCRDSAPNVMKNLLEMQQRLKTLTMDTKTTAREAAQCACAWDKLEARKAILKGRPANTSQSIRQDVPKRSKQSSNEPSGPEPTSEPEP